MENSMAPVLKLFCVMILVGLPVFAQDGGREASIKSMIGTVKIRKFDTQNWKDAHAKMPVKEKDALRTFVESQVEIVTSEGTLIRLEENTTMELSTFKQMDPTTQETKVSILNGTVFSNVKKLVNSNSRFNFETPTATASIRGTQVGFDVTSEKTSIKVFEGEVMVAPKGAASPISVKTNQMVTIIKGQKTAAVQTLTEKDKKTIGAPDTVLKKDTVQIKKDSIRTGSFKTDTVRSDTLRFAGKPDTAKTDTAHASIRIPFVVQIPGDGQTFVVPTIPVSGTAAPGSEVTVNGSKCPVAQNGSFSMKIPIPDEENEIVLDIEAVSNGAVQRITRTVFYKPVLTLSITSPQNQQLFNTTSIPITGQLSTPNADLSVFETKIPVQSSGKFSGFVTIPDEEGQVSLNFEATFQGATKSDSRTIVYQRLCDQNKPIISPAQLPVIYAAGTISFTVMDRTPDDEITFYKSIDGSRTSETGQPNSSFSMDLEEGVHAYSVYAEDKCKNRSQTVSGSIGYLKKIALVQVRRPAKSPEVIHIPPSRPDSDFNPRYTIEFSVLNLPDNDPRLIKEASVKNDATGQALVQSDLIDLNGISFDVDLKRGTNRITVQVKDINNNQIQSASPVIINVY
jgi:hypothetical protein